MTSKCITATPKKCHVAPKEGLFNRVGLLSPRRAAIAILLLPDVLTPQGAGLRGKDDLNGTSLTLSADKRHWFRVYYKVHIYWCRINTITVIPQSIVPKTERFL